MDVQPSRSAVRLTSYITNSTSCHGMVSEMSRYYVAYVNNSGGPFKLPYL